jgi:eukaryotic-like serine/threonine-protein kinase
MLVMECVEGETLSTLLTDTRASGAVLPVDVATGVLIQALHGLHAAHEALDDSGRCLNLVHRDFSPHNLMINKDGLVKVLDFGIAKAAFESHVTRTGHVCGKFAYISPEQLQGRQLDRRADIFSAGVVLWEALTCERLFGNAKLAEVKALRNIMHKRVPPPSELRKGIDPVLDRIVLRALERDPAKRFASARDFAFALEAGCPSAPPSSLARALADFCQVRVERKASAIAEFRREITEQMSFASLAPEEHDEPAEALSEPHESKTRDVRGAVVRGKQAHAERRWTRFGFALAGLLVVSLGWLTRRALAPSHSRTATPAVTRGFPAASERPPSVTVHVAAAMPAGTATAIPAATDATDATAASPATALVELTSEASASPREKWSTARPSRERRRAIRPAATASAAPQCLPPTYTDDEGIRHFKAGCI